MSLNKPLFPEGSRPRIAIVVQGRFYAFDLARVLIAKGVPVQVLTNYPSYMAERFGIPRAHVTGFPVMGLLHRYAYRWNLVGRCQFAERLLHEGFSRWASAQIKRSSPEVVHAFSGVALEIFRDLDQSKHPILRQLTRGSAHIRDQFKDLSMESRRANSSIELPSQWMMNRERQEYQAADQIVTLSSFARGSFIRRGYDPDRVKLLLLGSNVRQFRPGRAIVDQRLARMRSGKRLRVVFTGNISLQKGLIDLIAIASALKDQMDFQLVGNVTPDAASRFAASQGLFQFTPRVPEGMLPEIYNAADVYLFPTLHDGFAAVLAQAKSACLPILSTDHCGGPDLIQQGTTGWVLPIRRPDLFIERLRWCDANREELAQCVENLWQSEANRDWEAVAEDYLSIVDAGLRKFFQDESSSEQ